jgi:hypothetical protein
MQEGNTNNRRLVKVRVAHVVNPVATHIILKLSQDQLALFQKFFATDFQAESLYDDRGDTLVMLPIMGETRNFIEKQGLLLEQPQTNSLGRDVWVSLCVDGNEKDFVALKPLDPLPSLAGVPSSDSPLLPKYPIEDVAPSGPS